MLGIPYYSDKVKVGKQRNDVYEQFKQNSIELPSLQLILTPETDAHGEKMIRPGMGKDYPINVDIYRRTLLKRLGIIEE